MLFKNGFQVFDIHAHLPYPIPFMSKHPFVAGQNALRTERMRLTWDFPSASPKEENESPQPLIDRWAEELDRYGIGGITQML